MDREIRIVISDDHPLLRQGVRRVIDAEPGMIVVAETGDGNCALESIQSRQPDIAILDIEMPGLDGLAVARLVREQQLPVQIIILTAYRDADFFNRALERGVKGYVLKDSTVTDIVSAIKAVNVGEQFASPELLTYLLSLGHRDLSTARPQAGLEELTLTERRVLNLIAEYKTSKEIAKELNISPRTVENHRANISHKLGVKGSHALIRFALEHK